MENESLAATRWTLVLAAARRDDPEPAMRALAELCQTYWPPLYAYIRRQGLIDNLIDRRPKEDRPADPIDGVAVLTDAYWRSRFDASPNALGATVKLDGEAYTIAGVLPAKDDVAEPIE